MKTKRFIIEYANHKITEYLNLIKEYPQNEKLYSKMIYRIDCAVRLAEYGQITIDECIRAILESSNIAD